MVWVLVVAVIGIFVAAFALSGEPRPLRDPATAPVATATEVLAALPAELPEGPLILVSEGGYDESKPWPVWLMRFEGRAAPTFLWEGRMLNAEARSLVEQLSARVPTWTGEVDRLVGDGQWRFGWTSAPDPFCLFDRRGLLARVDNGALEFVRTGRRLAEADITEVRAELSKDWIHRGVSVQLRAGKRVTVYDQRAWLIALAPYYDGLNLMDDTGWVHSIAHALSEALGVPVWKSPEF